MEPQIGICPRCGRDLVRGMTPTGKVCFNCPSCAGVAVTLPALRESLDVRSIAALTMAARAAEHSGCLCPGCGGRMSLLKVGDGKSKLEIDVCGRCLSVWCDKGEYETLAPFSPQKQGELTMRQLLERTSPDARQRYADAIAESLPEEVSPEDFDIGDILCDVVRIVVGVPTLWRSVKPVSPIFTILLSLALPVAQACMFYRFHDLDAVGGYPVRNFYGYRDFWHINASMAEGFGFDPMSPLNALSFPFVQESGMLSLICAALLFMPLAAIERHVGHAKFIGMFLLFVVASAFAQAVFAAIGFATGRLCGIAPVALGLLVYVSCAWPEMCLKSRIAYMSIYAELVGLGVFVFQLLGAMTYDFLSYGVGPILACLALGAILGRRAVRMKS